MLRNANPATLPKISVVIPAYNEEDYLADCLTAVKNQTLAPHEIIVVDNNSTDNTAAIARSFAGVKIVFQETAGIAAARDAGFNTACGDIIVRTDADTRPDTDWLARTVHILSEDVQAVTGPIYYYDLPAQKLFKLLGIYIQTKLAGSRGRAKFLAGANMAIRRDTWRAVTSKVCRQNNIHEDLDLAIHLILGGYTIGYDQSMRVATSARRLRGDSQDFYKYMKAYASTYDLHHIGGFRVKVPMLCFMPLHFIAKYLSKIAKNEAPKAVKAFEKI